MVFSYDKKTAFGKAPCACGEAPAAHLQPKDVENRA
jgi:hypothetical protein